MFLNNSPAPLLKWATSCWFALLQSVQLLSRVRLFATPHGLQHSRLPCPSPPFGAYSNSYPLSWWCHPTISSSVIPFSHLQSFPASGSFQMNQFYPTGGQSIGVSALASVFPMNIQGGFPLGWTSWISLLSKSLSRVFSNTKELMLLNCGAGEDVWESLGQQEVHTSQF